MKEFDGIYSDIRSTAEELRGELDARRAALNSIMGKKNIFHN